MRRIIKPFAIMISAVILAASCLSDDNDYDLTYYKDTAITSFSLGTLKRIMTTKAKTEVNEDGTPKDSTYTVAVTGSNYKFNIDQTGRKIYNNDSLPKGTDAAHILCTVYSKNGGIITIKDVDSDTLRYYSNADSIDFTREREFRVYSTDGSVYRKYDVEVRVHKEVPDSFTWINDGATTAFTSMQGMKAVTLNGHVMVFGRTGNYTTGYTAAGSNGARWTDLNTGTSLDADAYKSMTVKNGRLFTVSGGTLMTSADGTSWQTTGTAALKRLAGAGSRKLYAIDNEGDIVSSGDNGSTWTKDALADDKTMLPKDEINLCSMPLKTNKNDERIIISGNRDLNEYPEDSIAVAWNKIEEYADNSVQHKWMPCNEENMNRLPRLSEMTMLAYDSQLAALGGKGLGSSKALPFSNIYVSRDNGLTWHTDSRYILPEEFNNNGSDVFTMTVDNDKFIWIICGGNGTVWRGRLNKVGWKEEQTAFTE